MMMQSKIALVTSTELSPVNPSWMEPTMAMAPMQTVREAVTKASTNLLSPLLPLFSRKNAPKVWVWCSKLMASPTRAPKARDTIIIMTPWVSS